MTGIYITIIIQALISIFLLYHNKNNDRKYNFLYLYLIVVTADFLFELFIYHLFNRETAYIESIPSSFRFLKGPLLLLFCLNCLGKNVSQKTIFFHLLPFFLVFLWNIIILPMVFSRANHTHLLMGIYQQIFHYYPYYWLSYVLLTYYHISKVRQPLSTELKYLKILTVYLIISIISYYISYKAGLNKDLLRTVYTYLFLVQFAIIIIMKLKSTTVEKQEEKVETIKYKTSSLSESTLKEIAENLLQTLKVYKLYLNEEITLEEVARQLQVSRHHLSQSITESLGTNFYDLINKCRVEEFVRIINTDHSQNISEVFYQCGFKSRTTFYKYFKKHMGLNPTDYKYQITQTTTASTLVNI